VEFRQAGADGRGRRNGITVKHDIDEGGNVDGMGDSLPHLQVLEIFVLEIDDELVLLTRIGINLVVYLQRGHGFQALQIRQGHRGPLSRHGGSLRNHGG